MVKSVSIKVVDTSVRHVGPFIKLIEEEFNVVFVDKDPDFVIHSCYGRDVLNYQGVRICVLGENLIPDFNVSDYGFASAHITFGDRYFRLPQYRLYADFEKLIAYNTQADSKKRDTFCTCVVSNTQRNHLFYKVFNALNKYKKISSGGRWNNNIGGPVEDKIQFLKTGKFTLVFENTSGSGYVTEKMMHALIAGTIPIYWGAPDVGLDFNMERIVNCKDYKTIDEILSRIIEIDTDDRIYESILRKPIFPNGDIPLFNQKNYIKQCIKSIFSQEKEHAYRRNNEFWGSKYQDDLNIAFHKPSQQLGRIYKGCVKQLIKSIG